MVKNRVFSVFRRCQVVKHIKDKQTNSKNRLLPPKIKCKIKHNNVKITAANISKGKREHEAKKNEIKINPAVYSEIYCPLKNMPAVKDDSKHKPKKVNIGFLVII